MSTLAKVKKGETVMLCVFTGMKIGPKEVTACDKSTITIHHNGKGDMTFERNTGKLIKPLPKNPKFSSFILEDDGTFVRPTRKGSKNKVKEEVKEEPVKKSKKPVKKSKKKAKPEPEEVEEEEAPAKKVKKATKKPIPKIEEIKKIEDDEEDWDDELEDDDDEDEYEDEE